MNAPSLQGIEWEGDFFAGSKKAHMKKILLACNTLTAISADAYRDHASLYYHLGKDFPKFQFQQFFSRRLSIDRFRNTAFRFAIDLGIDYLFFIDDDMQFHHTVFKQLYEGCEKKGYDILAALNYIRGYPFDPMAFSFQTNVNGKRQLLHLSDEVINESAGGILKCDAIGTAVCLIKMKNVKTVPPAWFVTGPHNTEDIYFCLKCKDYFKKLKVGVHTGAITGHLLDPEIISYHTRKHLKDYYESYMSKDRVEEIKSQDRGLAYVNSEVLPALENIVTEADARDQDARHEINP